MVGSREMRDELLPLRYIESSRQKSEIDVSPIFYLSDSDRTSPAEIRRH